MLLQFTFKNFRSFKDENILDMRATKVKELAYHVRITNKEKVLPMAAIYGANASGKSNVISALKFMKMCVTSSVMFSLKIDDNTLKFPYSDNVRFSFIKNTDETNSTFETIFILPNKKKYLYGFIIDKNGFKEEWLKLIQSNNMYKDIIIRNDDELVTYETKQSKLKENIKKSLNNTSLVLTLGAMLNDDLLIDIRNLFNSIDIIDFGSPIKDIIISKSIVSSELVTGKLKDILINYISSFDNSIIDYSIEKQNNEDNDKPSYKIYTHHKMLDNNGTKKLSLQNESSGTQKMIALFLHFYETLKQGGILIVDELNAKLHPLLMRAIINLFADPETNPNNAQLIFTTHDVWLMDSEILRRDEIWFTEKNSDGVSELYSFVDLKGQDGKTMRKDLNFMKNYMLGKFGGVPKLKQFQIEFGENNGQK